jgi:hypothetical protein
MKAYEFDVVTDEIPLDETIKRLYSIDGVISVGVLQNYDSGNGWPVILVVLHESEETFSELEEIFPDYQEDEIGL